MKHKFLRHWVELDPGCCWSLSWLGVVGLHVLAQGMVNSIFVSLPM